MSNLVTVLAFLTGLLTGALFAYLEIPIPAPPSIAGVLGIFGIYAGFKLVEWSGASFDLLGALGLG
jgi:XapX domain-containing protein